MGGTAEKRAAQIILGLGAQGKTFTPNEQTDQEAKRIIQQGNQQLIDPAKQQQDLNTMPE